MIEILDWFAKDGDRILGFMIVFLAMCWGLSWIGESWSRK